MGEYVLVDAEPLKVTAVPAVGDDETVNEGVTRGGANATPNGPLKPVIAVPGALFATVIGVTVFVRVPATYATLPSGLNAMPTADPVTGIAVPAVLLATAIGVTVLLVAFAT